MDLFPLLHDWKYDAVCSPLITSKGGPHFLVSSPHGELLRIIQILRIYINIQIKKK